MDLIILMNRLQLRAQAIKYLFHAENISPFPTDETTEPSPQIIKFRNIGKSEQIRSFHSRNVMEKNPS